MVFFSFFKIQYKKVEKKNKHDVSGSVSVEKPKPVAFLCCKLNFYFHIHLWFLQALKQDNKRICSNVQSVSHFNFSQSNVALDTKLRFQCQAQFTCCCWRFIFLLVWLIDWFIFFFGRTFVPLRIAVKTSRTLCFYDLLIARQDRSGLIMWNACLLSTWSKHITHLLSCYVLTDWNHANVSWWLIRVL